MKKKKVERLKFKGQAYLITTDGGVWHLHNWLKKGEQIIIERR